MPYNPSDWYFVANDHNPTTEVWSTASNAFVSNSGAAYLAWLDVPSVNFGTGALITGAANNGSGAIRLTLANDPGHKTGQRWRVNSVGVADLTGIAPMVGLAAAVNHWEITRIDATHVDLVSSTYNSSDPWVSGGVFQGATIVATEAALSGALVQTFSLASRSSRVSGISGSGLSGGNACTFTVNECEFRDSSAQGQVVLSTALSLSIDINTAGPIANGRDQSGAFSAGDTVHFYIIAGSPSQAVAGIVSKTDPYNGGPTLPLGYLNWAYATTIILDGSALLPGVALTGDWVHYRSTPTILSGGSATSDTSVSYTAYVPTIATIVQLVSNNQLVTNGGGGADESFIYEIASSAAFDFGSINVQGASEYNYNGHSFAFPNQGSVFYKWVNNAGAANVATRSANLLVQGYKVPNGD